MGKELLSLRQFIQRQQAIALYRDLLRAVRGIEDAKQRSEMKMWIRDEFERWRHNRDEETAGMLLSQGRVTLREIKTSIGMAK